MPLTKEHKIIILNLLDEEDAQKGILEDTAVGETYGELGGVTADDISNYLKELKGRELNYLDRPKRRLLLNFREPIHFEMPDGRSCHVQSMKIDENAAGNARHLVIAVLPLLGDMTPVDPPVEMSIWLAVNMRSIQELNK